MRKSGAAVVLLAASSLLLLAAGRECPARSSPVLDEISLREAYDDGCTSVEGDLVVGFANCSSQCNLTSLSLLSGLVSVTGSLVIQCCPLLEELSGLSELTDVSGTLRIYYNPRLHTISGLGAVSSLRNLEISQNANLTQISGLSSLEMIRGYLQIDHNQNLVNLDGLSNLRSIGGADLVAGHALNILYNPSLFDLRWLQNFTRIESGTVHIEGNSGLCYAGYPQWIEGGFELRPPAGDRGVDWRRLLGPGVPRWQYSWGAEGYPTLLIQNNARYDDCNEAMCHETCEEGAGCLGPSDPDLCGSCVEGVCEIGASPTTPSCDPTSLPYWPPTEFPYSLVFGVLFGLGGLVLLGLVLLGGWVVYRICKRLRAGRKDTFDIIVNEEMEMVGMELRRRDSGIIAGTSSPRQQSTKTAKSAATAETKGNTQKGGNVVLTSMSYRLRPLPSEEDLTAHTVSASPPTTRPATTTTSDTTSSSAQPLPLPTSTTVTTSPPPPPPDTPPPDSAPSPSVQQTQTQQQELGKPLQSIPEDLEEEEKEGEESTDGPISTAPVRRLYKHDTLTRLQKGESTHVQMTFPRGQVKLKKEIGKGDFGLVLFAEARKLVAGEKKTPVIVKQLRENSSRKEQENFLRPVEAMSLIKHPNVLSLLGACVDGPPIMILMEYCPHGNLKTYLVRKRREAAAFREGGKLMDIACQMAAGLTYLHSNSIAHNDFAVRSCLVSDTETVKLGDYGLTRQVFEEDYYSRGGGQKAWPVRWMAPEQMIVKGSNVLDSHPVSTTANVWSFGISLWEVGTFAQWPYFDLSNEEVIDTVQSSRECILENPFQPSDQLSPLYDIMQLCWKVAEERPTMAGVLQRLESLRDDIARNTPSSRKKKNISLSHSPKTTPSGTPIVPHNKATPTATPTQPHTNRATPTQPYSKKATPTTMAPKPHPNRVPPKTTPTKPHLSSATPTEPHPRPSDKRKSYPPRRPAPKLPEEGSLKRRSRTTIPTSIPNDAHQHQPNPNDAHQQQPIPNDAHQHQPIPNNAHQHQTIPNDAHQHQHVQSGADQPRHPLQQNTIKEEIVKHPSNEPLSSEHDTATGRVNPNFAEAEQEDEDVITGAGKGEREGELGDERDVEEGVMFVNRAAEAEEGEMEEEVETVGDFDQIDNIGRGGGGGEWDMDDGQEWGDEDFILEPPIDFSQPGAEDNDLPPDLYNPDESQCTSIDDFEPVPELPPSPKTSPKGQRRNGSSTASRGGSAHNLSSTASERGNSKSKKKKKKKREGGEKGRRGVRGDGTQVASPLLTYHTQRETQPQLPDSVGGSWNEPEFDNDGEEGEDSRYRRPTGQISKALLKRAPSWSRSGASEGEDELPGVVYDDDISALIW